MHTCLIVDDDPGHRMLTRLVVDACGRFRTVGEAQDGVEAIDLARRLAPDLVLLDLTMPRMTGVQALPDLLQVTPRSTIYVLSTVRDAKLLREARRAGAHGFLDKMMPGDRLAAELVKLDLRSLDSVGTHTVLQR